MSKGQLWVIENAPVAVIESNEIAPDVLLLVKLTVLTPLLEPTVTEPKLIEVGETV